MYDWTTTSTLALGCVVVLYIGQRAFRSRTSYLLPPGPPGLPWVGNVIGVKADAPWVTYADWGKTYGDLVYSRLVGKDVIIINSEKVAKDLLEIRSKNYSDRPYSITNDMCGIGSTTVFMPYGDRWRLHRRFFHRTFRSGVVTRFLPFHHRSAYGLLRRLFNAPELLKDHIFEYTTAVILNSTYCYDPATSKDGLVDIVANALDIIVPVMRPDVALKASAFPWLFQLPAWLPGMSLKREMLLANKYSKQYFERPFEYALRNMPGGNTTPSLVHDALSAAEKNGISPEQSWMDDLKMAAGGALLAGSGTSDSVLLTFFLMMLANPSAQGKAQAQIDALLCNTRLPTVKDRPLLPFIDAILRETHRYSPVVPLSGPRATVDDDVYDGYHIPKGAILLTNLWGMAHDESRYPNPHEFIPERFLNDDGSLKPNDTDHIAYGFGRRMCGGRHFADATLWIAIASILAVFKILPPIDENGVEIPVEPKFSSGIVVHPLPFECRIVPRLPGMDAEKLEQLIAANDV